MTFFRNGKIFFIFVGLIVSIFLFSFSFAQTRSAVLLDINGAIGPATQDYIHQGLAQAAENQAAVIIIQLDTPGGLDKAMRGIIRDILASPIPVISFVAPSGARAASAGTYILYASSLAAMAPGTNLGAATPVSLGIGQEEKSKTLSPLEMKVRQDAIAYLRSLAQLHGRNAEWAEKAVSQATSLSANDAMKSRVVDFVANDISDLLQKANGRTVMVQGQKKVLQTLGLTVTAVSPDWQTKFLSVITDPNMAYILMIIGIWGLFLEFSHPGYILPGVTGAICLLLALYAFQLLPINYAGLGLMVLGIGCMVAEAFFPSFGALGVGGVIAFIIGSVMLLKSSTPGFEIALPLILSVSIVSAGFFLFIVNLAIRSRFRSIVSGREELMGQMIEIASIDERGKAWTHLHGELWQVHAENPLRIGQKVKVKKIEGIILHV